MTESLRQSTREVFQYPRSALIRRHGPRGYADYVSYKPWLRDEFLFRCVYCLSRERWKPEGQEPGAPEQLRGQAAREQAQLRLELAPQQADARWVSCF